MRLVTAPDGVISIYDRALWLWPPFSVWTDVPTTTSDPNSIRRGRATVDSVCRRSPGDDTDVIRRSGQSGQSVVRRG